MRLIYLPNQTSATYEIEQFLLLGITRNIVQGNTNNLLGGFFQVIASSHVRRNQTARLIPQRVLGGQWLRFGNVQSSTMNTSLTQRHGQRVSINGITSSGVNNYGGGLQLAQAGGERGTAITTTSANGSKASKRSNPYIFSMPSARTSGCRRTPNVCMPTDCASRPK